MGKYLKKFNSSNNYENYLDTCYININDLAYKDVIGYINSNEVRYGKYSNKIFSFSNTTDFFSGFTSKKYNMIPPENLNIYALNRIEDDPEDNTKFKMIFKKQNYMKAGIPYYIKLKNEELRDPNNEYIFKIYDGEVDDSNILIDSSLFASVYDLTSFNIGKYYVIYNDKLYYSQGGTFTDADKKSLFKYSVFFGAKYNDKSFSEIITED